MTSKRLARGGVEHARVDRGGLLAGARVELGAHRVEDLVDLQRAVARGAAEEHVLDQVRQAGLGLVLGGRARADPEAQRDGSHGVHGLRDDPYAGVELRQAVLGVHRDVSLVALGRAPLRCRGRPEPRGPPRSPPPPSRRAPRSPPSRSRAARRRRRRRRRCRRPPAPRPTCRRSPGRRPGAGRCGRARGRPRPRARWISSPLLRTSSTVSTRWPGETLEMCSRPSVPLASSTNAPKVVVLTTLPANSSPTSTSLVIVRMRSASASPSSPLAE